MLSEDDEDEESTLDENGAEGDDADSGGEGEPGVRRSSTLRKRRSKKRNKSGSQGGEGAAESSLVPEDATPIAFADADPLAAVAACPESALTVQRPISKPRCNLEPAHKIPMLPNLPKYAINIQKQPGETLGNKTCAFFGQTF